MLTPQLPIHALLGLLPLVAPAPAHFDHPIEGGVTASVEEPKEDRSITLLPPDKRWRMLTASELRNLAPDAIAGLAGTGSMRTVLRVREELRGDLEELVREHLDGQRLGLTSYAFVETLQIGEHTAVHALVNGKQNGSWWRHHVVAFKDDGKLVSLHSWGRSEEVPVDGSAFLAATAGLRSLSAEDFEELSAIRHLPDRDGPGWSLRGGTYVDAALGFKLTPRGPWRVALHDELATTMGPEFRVGLTDEQHEAWMGVVVEHVPGIDPEKHMGLRRQEACEVGHTLDTRRAKVAGERVELRQLTLPAFNGRPGDAEHMLHATYFRGDQCLQVFVRYPSHVEQAVRVPLEQALDALSWLDEPEREALIAAMGKLPRDENVVGDSWVQRGPVFTDFRLGFQWTPANGFWELESAPERDSKGSGVQVLVRERGLGLNGWLSSESVQRGTDAEAYHLAEFKRLFGARPMDEVSERAGLAMGEAQGILTFCTPADTMTPVRYVLATVVTSRRALTVLLDATPAAMLDAREEVLSTLAGLRVSDRPLRRSEMKQGSYRDFRMGFELMSPETDWLFEESTIEHYGDQAAKARGVACGFEGGGGRGVFAAGVWSEAIPSDLSGPPRNLLPGAFSDLARLPHEAPELDQIAKFRGRTGRLLGWTDGDRRLEVMLVIERGTLFCVGAVSLPGDPAPRERLSGFRVLD